VTQNSPGSGPDNRATEGDLAGPVIADLVAEELEAARAMAASVQTRGLAVISSSGTLVVLLFGLSTLATKAQNFTLPMQTKPPLYLAAVFFVLAASTGITTNLPQKKDAIALSTLHPLLKERYWNVSAVHAKREVAKSQLTILESQRRTNIRRARFLTFAITFELIGLTCVMLAVIMLIAAG
jgi:hypothetical protein